MEIHQFQSSTSPGDAITNNTLELQKFLKEKGYKSRVFAEHCHPQLKGKVDSITSYSGNPENVLIIHHAIGFSCFDLIKNLPDRKILIYHNITPPYFFDGYDNHIIPSLFKGKKQLEEFRDVVEFAFGVSEYNRSTLIQCGYPRTDSLPIMLNLQSYENKLNSALYEQYQDSKNFLFVGRLLPNKCQKDVIYSFYSYHRYENTNSRLFLIGSFEGMETYYRELLELSEKLSISEHVFIPGKISFEDLCTYYKLADIFLCMSEHEGFCVPLLESFHFGVPVIAYDSSAVAYTMKESGILLREKDYRMVGALMGEIVENEELREKIITKQRERLRDFDREIIGKKLLERISG